VRNTYPSILPNGIDTLKGRVRLEKLLIGYEIGLTITINDSSTWQSAYSFLQTAQRTTGGGFSIFGFHFGAGGTTTTHRNITDVHFVDNKSSGQIVIPPSLPGLTFMMGALGKAL